jgi:hypothetical protein
VPPLGLILTRLVYVGNGFGGGKDLWCERIGIGDIPAAIHRVQRPLSRCKGRVPIPNHVLEDEVGIRCFQSWPETLEIVVGCLAVWRIGRDGYGGFEL